MHAKYFFVLSIAVALAPLTHAGTLVVPNSNQNYPTATQADGPFHDGEMRRVILMNENQLTAMVGKTITGVAFKVHALQTTTWPSTTANYTACELYLGPSVHPGAKSLTFLSNYTGTRTQVRTGSISVPPNSVPTGNNFHPFISITPYVYSGGHLVLEHSRRGFHGSYAWITAVRQSDAEYNNSISAVRTGTDDGATGTQHNAPVTLFQYEDPEVALSGTVSLTDYVGALSSVPVQIQVYPAGNPTAVHTQMITLGNSGEYSVSLPSSIGPGNYDLAVNGSPFLRTLLSNQSLGAGGNLRSFSMRNGDVDDSSEVDAADIDFVIAVFGNAGTNVLGDVDGSEEVDAADIDIVISNFGATDE